MNKKDYINHNRNAWNKQSEKGIRWSTPVRAEEIMKATAGDWDVILTPWKAAPKDWFGDIKGKKILCLASGGGQQAPILAAAGAEVISFDISENQLSLDRAIAERDKLNLTAIQGEMTDLSAFNDGKFDLIFHPVANCFIENVNLLWREAFRVLKPKGTLLAGFNNPLVYLFDQSEDPFPEKLVVKYKIPYSDLEQMTEEELEEMREKDLPFEFGHTLEDQIGGLIKAGFSIAGFYEDKYYHQKHPLYNAIPSYIAVKAYKY